jgi:PHD/YefM family antitoxin component YafN of YafNO toxin-antitoxin module
MKRVTSAELARRFSVSTDAAVTEPVFITRHGRDRLVLLSVERYYELLKAAAEVRAAGRNAGTDEARTDYDARGEGGMPLKSGAVACA